jgi:hypothetical protein
VGGQSVDGCLVLPEEDLGDAAVGLDVEQDGCAGAHREVWGHKRTSRQSRLGRVEVIVLNTERKLIMMIAEKV